MAQIGRSFQPQALNSAGPIIGPREPSVLSAAAPFAPVLVNFASDLLRRRFISKRFPLQGWNGDRIAQTGSTAVFGATERFLGPEPPSIIGPLPSQQQTTLQVDLLPVDRIGRRYRRHNITFFLNPPTVVTPAPTFIAPPVETKLCAVVTSRARPVATQAQVAQPIIVNPLPSQQAQIIQNTFAPRPRVETRSFLSPPTVTATAVQTFSGPKVTLTHTRPRRVASRLRAPVFYAQTSEIVVVLVHTRPRATKPSLSPPEVLRVFFGPEISLTRTRPRQTSKNLSKPTVVRVPSVEQQEDSIRVSLTRTRPRPTTRLLSEPTVLQVFEGPRVSLARTRPRPTVRTLGEPTVIRVPSVEQQEDTIRVSLARTRPRRTTVLLGEPTILQIFSAGKPALVHTRPRPTVHLSVEPTVVRIPSVEQREQTIQVSLVRTRPRATSSKLRAPTVITVNPPVDSTVNVSLAGRTRIESQRRAAHYKLRPPTAVIPLPTQRAQTVQVALAKLARRFVRSKLSRPTVLQVFSGPDVFLVRIRPRPTTKRFINPVTYRATSEILVVLVKTRPRPTSRVLAEPTVVSTPATLEQQTITVALVRTRPRPTVKRFIVPYVAKATSEISITLVRARPRPTTRQFIVPTAAPSTSEISVTLVRTRPRPTVRTLASPAVVQPFTAPGTRVTCNAVETRVEAQRRASHYRLAAPAAITTPPPVLYPILVALAGRTRVEEQRRAPHYKLFPPRRVFGAPLEIRVVGPPRSAWSLRKMVIGWESDAPSGDMQAGKPVEGWDSDTPDTGWEVGKPK